MDIDETLLGPGAPLTPGDLRGVESFTWFVSPLISAIALPLAKQISRTQGFPVPGRPVGPARQPEIIAPGRSRIRHSDWPPTI